MSNLALKPTIAFSKLIGTGDGALDIVAAPGAGNRIVVTNLRVAVVTTAAQTVTVGDTSGTVPIVRLGASVTVGTQHRADFPNSGLRLTVNEALRYAPSAAGYSLMISGEYFIEGKL